MESFENSSDNGFFDGVIFAFLKDNEEIGLTPQETSIDEIEISDSSLSSSELIKSIGDTFEKYGMNAHFASIDLLGNLGYTDLLMYYCIVMDCLLIENETEKEEQQIKVMTPEDYISKKDKLADEAIELRIETERAKLHKIIKILNYLKNKEFEILSNTFYMDGTDFILLLGLKSTVGYNLRLKIVVKHSSQDELIGIEENFRNLQQIIITGEEDE